MADEAFKRQKATIQDASDVYVYDDLRYLVSWESLIEYYYYKNFRTEFIKNGRVTRVTHNNIKRSVVKSRKFEKLKFRHLIHLVKVILQENQVPFIIILCIKAGNT